ncbi:hypothetical protein Tco_0842493 [Tanacetum coccineum]|uniref:Uncharacterized protein n=1 Tax=Tanacetum coccineum TaxID=301880 RepID=A0ABQ5AZF4_9ASTR
MDKDHPVNVKVRAMQEELLSRLTDYKVGNSLTTSLAKKRNSSYVVDIKQDRLKNHQEVKDLSDTLRKVTFHWDSVISSKLDVKKQDCTAMSILQMQYTWVICKLDSSNVVPRTA